MQLLEQIKSKARMLHKTIALPEPDDIRVLKAAGEIADQGIAGIKLIGDKTDIGNRLTNNGIKSDGIEIIDILTHPDREKYIDTLYKLRQAKGMTLDQAAKLIESPLYFGTMMVYGGDADGMVAGAANTTGDVLRPALQIIKPRKGYSTVSGAFLMLVPDCELGHNGLFVFADCAVNINPDAATLAEIGMQAALTAKRLCGIDPVVGFLSFSTKGSAKHEFSDKVAEAVNIIRQTDPTLCADGELQVDAAIIEQVAGKKAPGSPVGGRANVLIFPDLQSGNIGYKLVERLAKATAIGPILQGLAKPVNDLSRGCSADDIVNMAAITSLQSGG